MWLLLCFSCTLTALPLPLPDLLLPPPLPGSAPSTPENLVHFNLLIATAICSVFICCFDSVHPGCLQPSQHSPLIFLIKLKGAFLFSLMALVLPASLNDCVLRVLSTAYLPLNSPSSSSFLGDSIPLHILRIPYIVYVILVSVSSSRPSGTWAIMVEVCLLCCRHYPREDFIAIFLKLFFLFHCHHSSRGQAF